MNLKDELTCKHCNEIYTYPIMLTCCGENICKHHIDHLVSNSGSNKFTCPICNEENASNKLNLNKFMQKMVENELHKFQINSNYKETLNKFKKEIENLEYILKDPDNVIYEEINEIKRKVDLDRERSKVQIDELADGFIKKLEEYEEKFKSEYKSNVDLHSNHDLVESSKRQLFEYEKCLNLFSVKREERDEKTKQSEKEIDSLKLKIKELIDKMFSNLSIQYRQKQNEKEDLFGKLIIKVIKIFFSFSFN